MLCSVRLDLCSNSVFGIRLYREKILNFIFIRLLSAFHFNSFNYLVNRRIEMEKRKKCRYKQSKIINVDLLEEKRRKMNFRVNFVENAQRMNDFSIRAIFLFLFLFVYFSTFGIALFLIPMSFASN